MELLYLLLNEISYSYIPVTHLEVMEWGHAYWLKTCSITHSLYTNTEIILSSTSQQLRAKIIATSSFANTLLLGNKSYSIECNPKSSNSTLAFCCYCSSYVCLRPCHFHRERRDKESKAQSVMSILLTHVRSWPWIIMARYRFRTFCSQVVQLNFTHLCLPS